jgi:hypothetical protein
MLLRIGAAPGAKLEWVEACTFHREIKFAFSRAQEELALSVSLAINWIVAAGPLGLSA